MAAVESMVQENTWMSGGVELSVISPVLNEEFFLPLYLEAVGGYAGEILLLDGGSTDRSLEIIRNFQIKLAGKGVRVCCWQIPQEGKPYSLDWNEGMRRNFLVKKASGRWVLALDIDEHLSDNFPEVFREVILPDRKTLTYGFYFIPFWKDIHTVRKSVPEDPRWEGHIYRLVRSDTVSYNHRGNHSLLLCRGRLPNLCRERRILNEVTLFHYHYALGERIKENDNRRGDLGFPEGQGSPDWYFQPPGYQIRWRAFKGEHPRVIRNFLQGGDGG